jgi:aryl-alcohol dehydrogenase-like predicted oxidoreductase
MPEPSTALRPGFATAEGTQRFAARFSGRVGRRHFRTEHNLSISSIGIGTYLGEPDAATDQAYTDAVVAAVEGGINLVDSAINYRLQRSERAVGAALAKLEAAGYRRDEVIICTKGGFLTPDGAMPPDPGEYFFREFVEPGIFQIEEVAADSHCIAPRFLEDQLERSRRNLGLACLDVYYLHNPETQLSAISREQLHQRVRAAFEFLESAVASGRIRYYGLATWNGFRQAEPAPDYLSLAGMASIAREVAGDGHHFRFVQLPFNLAMTEALTRPNQSLDGRKTSMVEAARALGITLVASASLLQGHLGSNLPAYVGSALGLADNLQCALQFARSAPGITTALVGMSRVEHVRANLELARVEAASVEQFAQLFERREGA